MASSSDNQSPLTEMMDRAIRLREQRPGYQGLTKHFRAIQDNLTAAFKSSAQILHNGDKGTARENILKDFLERNKLLPARYGLSEASSHVLSSSGHMSNQVDLLLYDTLNSPRLLTEGGIQYFPVECCYGMIESKSNLSSKEHVCRGLDNIASFKRLQPRRDGRLTAPHGFGILFGCSSSLKWENLLEIVEAWEKSHDPTEWPNLITVHGGGNTGHCGHIRNGFGTLLTSPDIRDGRTIGLVNIGTESDALLTFYLQLIDLLNEIQLPRVELRRYTMLPAMVGRHSVRFELTGLAEEVDHCSHHGDFPRMFTEHAVEQILAACPNDNAISFAAALEKAYGRIVIPGTGSQGGPINIYNPENHPLPKLLLRPSPLKEPTLAPYLIIIDERKYWVPFYYAERDLMLTGCSQCGDREPLDLTIDQWWKNLESGLPPKPA